jgi:hypothetical protein
LHEVIIIKYWKNNCGLHTSPHGSAICSSLTAAGFAIISVKRRRCAIAGGGVSDDVGEWIEFHNGSTEADNLPDVALERLGTNINNVCTNAIARLDESTAPSCLQVKPCGGQGCG